MAGLWRVNGDLLQAVQAQRPAAQATLDMDATLIETHKRAALYCYKHFKAYQPLNSWWAEQGLIVHSEFRDGNVPAGHEQLRVLEVAARLLPAGVTKLYVRSDTAGYQQDLLKYCAEGKNERFGVIGFAIGADVTAEFRQAVSELPDSAWRPLDRIIDGERYAGDQQWAEVGYVPNWAGMSKTAPDYRFLAIREPLRELDLGDAEQLPFPTMSFPTLGRYKLFGLVTNRRLAGDDLIRWQRERCGKSEESARRDEGRSCWRAAAERAVRGQCGVVGDHGSRPQSQRDDETSGARRRLGGAAHEGDAVSSDRPAGPGRAPCAPADRPAFARRARSDPRRARRHSLLATGAKRMSARLLPPALQTPPASVGHGIALTAGFGRGLV